MLFVVLKSVRNCLPMQMVMKTFLRTSQQEMRCGFMGMMLKPRCTRRSGWGKGLLDQKKKSTDESVKDQGVVGCVFWLERLCPSWIYTTWSGGKRQLYQEVLARLRDAVRRKKPELWENQTWMLHHNNAPAHASLLIRSAFELIRGYTFLYVRKEAAVISR